MSWAIYQAIAKHRTLASRQQFKLASAVADRNLAVVERLLSKGANPNARIVGQKKEPIIFLTFEKSWFTLPCQKIGDRPKTSYTVIANSECLHLLLRYGADPNVRDNFGRTALETAILWCLPQTVKLLLLNGADPNLRAKNGQTPLMKSAILGIQDARPIEHKLQIIMHLLDSGAAIDAQAPDGKTALMYAVGNSRQEIVELLVSSGVSLDIADRQGNTAKDIINWSSSSRQQDYLSKILSQPQLDVSKYKYQQFIPEGDRVLATIIKREKQGDRIFFNDTPRKF